MVGESRTGSLNKVTGPDGNSGGKSYAVTILRLLLVASFAGIFLGMFFFMLTSSGDTTALSRGITFAGVAYLVMAALGLFWITKASKEDREETKWQSQFLVTIGLALAGLIAGLLLFLALPFFAAAQYIFLVKVIRN